MQRVDLGLAIYTLKAVPHSALILLLL